MYAKTTGIVFREGMENNFSSVDVNEWWVGQRETRGVTVFLRASRFSFRAGIASFFLNLSTTGIQTSHYR